MCQKQASGVETSNYIPQYLWDVITCPCSWYEVMKPLRLIANIHFTWAIIWKNCTEHGRTTAVPCVTARFVTRFNLWLRHDLWPHNASICDPARFVTKSASICDQRYTMILESNLCRGKLVFVFTLIMYTKWYNMMIYIYMNYDIILI